MPNDRSSPLQRISDFLAESDKVIAENPSEDPTDWDLHTRRLITLLEERDGVVTGSAPSGVGGR
ncbi:hypothetical protein CTZ27_18035 [Streptomyces griseocarneus]|nr:hypothetical protein CTZ27_18035 [Streptomyces griseocarneus]